MPETSGQFLPWLSPGRDFYLALALLFALGLAVRFLALRRWGADRLAGAERGLERVVLTLLFLTILFASVLQIILRNVLHRGIIWIDPLARHVVLWIAFLGALAATGRARHVAIDAVPLLLKPRLRSAIKRAAFAGAAVVSAVLANGAIVYLNQEREFGGEALPGVPTWVAHSILFFGFVFLAFRFLVVAVQGIDPEGPGDAATLAVAHPVTPDPLPADSPSPADGPDVTPDSTPDAVSAEVPGAVPAAGPGAGGS